jgi:hypothetical protein
MRFTSQVIFLVCALYSLTGSVAKAQMHTSFGPEISAEDFDQHQHVLSKLKLTRQRRAYIQQQFQRLGLNANILKCTAAKHTLQATLADTHHADRSVIYFAQLGDNYAVASVLEIAERFASTRPRPLHEVRFIFSTTASETLQRCPPQSPGPLWVHIKNTQQLDSGSLVQYLNTLHHLGK